MNYINLIKNLDFLIYRMEEAREYRKQQNQQNMEENKMMSSGFIVSSMDNNIDVDLRENELRKLSSLDEKFQISYSLDS